ncbi:MAG: 2-oxoglutarate and iron-dependent oxygenase domain-containing protein, partial [Stenotrophomonas sp.]
MPLIEPNSTGDAVPLHVRGIVPVSMSRYDVDFQGFSDALGASFSRYGFAVVSDHGLDEAVIAAAIDDAKAFFALPEAVKRAYH